MAEFIKVEVKGLAELQRALSRFPKILQERYAVDAIARGAAVLQREIADRAPVRQPQAGEEEGKRVTKGKRTKRYPGNLKRSIHIRRVPANASYVQFEIGPSKAGWYGRLVEFGTKRAAAHPFMRPALDSKGEAAIDESVKVLAADLDKAVEESK